MNLNDITSPADIRSMSIDQLSELADELRSTLLDKLAAHGGHIGPNLGMVEATIALHYVFDTPDDKLVFDVSHQSYIHKMLTGRIKAFTDPAHYDEVTGYTNPDESEFDLFKIGHTSTSVSLAGGLAKARDLRGGHENVVAVIGDGSLSGGEAFEGLDFGATLGSNFIVVVNDNDMSIAENHGGLYADLRLLRNTNGEGEPNYFRTLGYAYRYVKYGNDLRSLIKAFKEVKDYPYPIVVHINTQKGMGFAPAERDRETFHYGAPFDRTTGQPLTIDDTPDYSDIFYDTMRPLMQQDPTVAVITAGTPGVLGITSARRREAGRQFIDVGIAEQEAVALASGMAKGGARPVFGVVSSFVQRAYDQLSQDVAINDTPAVVNIFYGGVRGMNDVTHLGWFDIALISNIPGWVYLAPTCADEYRQMLVWAVRQRKYPVAVRVPSGSVWSDGRDYPSDYSELNKAEIIRRGKDVAVVAAGSTMQNALKAVTMLAGQGHLVTLINPRYLSGLDIALLDSLKSDHKAVITLEEGVLDGGYGEKIARYYGNSDMRVYCYGIKKEFADRYNITDMMARCGLTADAIADNIRHLL